MVTFITDHVCISANHWESIPKLAYQWCNKFKWVMFINRTKLIGFKPNKELNESLTVLCPVQSACPSKVHLVQLYAGECPG